MWTVDCGRANIRELITYIHTPTLICLLTWRAHLRKPACLQQALAGLWEMHKNSTQIQAVRFKCDHQHSERLLTELKHATFQEHNSTGMLDFTTNIGISAWHVTSWRSVSSQAKPDCGERIRVWTKAKTALNLHHQLLSWKSLGCSFTCSEREKSIAHADSVDPFFVDTENPSTESSPNDAPEIGVCFASSSGWREVDLKRPERFLLVSQREREGSLQLQNLQRRRGFIPTPYCATVPAQSNKQKLDFNSFPTTTSTAPL